MIYHEIIYSILKESIIHQVRIIKCRKDSSSSLNVLKNCCKIFVASKLFSDWPLNVGFAFGVIEKRDGIFGSKERCYLLH